MILRGNPAFNILLIFTFQSCSKDQEIYNPTNKLDPYVLYKDGLEAFERNQFFIAEHGDFLS